MLLLLNRALFNRAKSIKHVGAIVLAYMLVCSPALAQNNLPALGEASGGDLSPSFERRLGDDIMREIRHDPDYVDDPILLEYIQSIWGRLIKAARQHGEITDEIDTSFSWEPFLIRDRTINAFALPGGYIGIHLGLIALTTSQDELASVLGHELSHVTQRHIVRSISREQRSSMLSLASMIVGILAASRAPQAAQAIMAGGQALASQDQLNFSRDMEREADRVGYTILTSAGFAPAGMASMFEKLEQAMHLNDDGNYPYLRSHPLTSERIGAARARMGIKQSSIPIDPIQLLMRARARVLMDTRSVALQPFIHIAESTSGVQQHHVEFVADAYAATLAAIRLHDQPLTRRMLKLTLSTAQSLPTSLQTLLQPQLQLLQAETALSLGDYTTADQVLTAFKDIPASRPVSILRAQRVLLAAVSEDELNQVAANLQTAVVRTPYDATTWQLLAQIWLRLNQPLRAIRAEAEASASLGDLEGAIDRLTNALKKFKSNKNEDILEASVLDARLRSFKKELHQLKQDFHRP